MFSGSVLRSTKSSARTDNPPDFRIPKKQTAPIDKAALVIGLIDARLGDIPTDQIQHKEPVIVPREQMLKSADFNSKVQYTAQEESAVKIDKFMLEKERKPSTPMPVISSEV